jgi:hypothetical protein
MTGSHEIHTAITENDYSVVEYGSNHVWYEYAPNEQFTYLFEWSTEETLHVWAGYEWFSGGNIFWSNEHFSAVGVHVSFDSGSYEAHSGQFYLYGSGGVTNVPHACWNATGTGGIELTVTNQYYMSSSGCNGAGQIMMNGGAWCGSGGFYGDVYVGNWPTGLDTQAIECMTGNSAYFYFNCCNE